MTIGRLRIRSYKLPWSVWQVNKLSGRLIFDLGKQSIHVEWGERVVGTKESGDMSNMQKRNRVKVGNIRFRSTRKTLKKRAQMKDLKVNKTNILPLRWFANMCGEIAGWAILRATHLDEIEDFGRKYNFYSFIWRITWPVYCRFGSFYEFDFDMSGDGWNDYDENGVPYWEKTGVVDPDYFPAWDYIDEETGDAFRLIKK